jgi:hypothetical protein
MARVGTTGWMRATDPSFARVGDAWMRELLADFQGRLPHAH